MNYYAPVCRPSSETISLLEEISKMEGEIQTLARRVDQDLDIQFDVAIDSVHFSTRIEGNTLTREQVTKALTGKNEKSKSKTHDIKEVINYARARRMLSEQAAKGTSLTTKLILETHRDLLSGIFSGKLRGFFRLAQNVIKDSKTNKIIYLPAEAKDVPELMDALCKGISRGLTQKSHSPLILAACFHYQFVTIHPFMDGNGRAARLLTNFLLLSKKYEFIKYAAIEKAHEQNRARYYSELRRHQASNYYDIPLDLDITGWVNYWLQCAKSTCLEAVERLSGIRSEVPLTLPTRLQIALGLFKNHIRLSAKEYQELTGLGRTQAVEDLNLLVKHGWIVKSGGGRSSVYLYSVNTKEN